MRGGERKSEEKKVFGIKKSVFLFFDSVSIKDRKRRK